MAEIFKFFNSAPGDERWHYASDFADYFGSVLSSGLISNGEAVGLQVTVNSGTMTTSVDVGKAIIKGYSYENTTPLTLTHSIPEQTLDRIDRVVLRLDLKNASRFIKVFVKEGVSALEPIPPTLQRDQYIYELSLAQVRIRKNTSSIVVSDIKDERVDENLCGIVQSLITVPTSVFQQQFDVWFASIADVTEQSVTDWQIAQQQAFTSWFDSIKGQLDSDVGAKLASDLATHQAEDATLTTKGHVQLSNALNSVSEVHAATSKALKQAYDKAIEATDIASSKNLVIEKYTTPGTFLWTVPKGVNKVFVSACGGGGAGGADGLIGSNGGITSFGSYLSLSGGGAGGNTQPDLQGAAPGTRTYNEDSKAFGEGGSTLLGIGGGGLATRKPIGYGAGGSGVVSSGPVRPSYGGSGGETYLDKEISVQENEQITLIIGSGGKRHSNNPTVASDGCNGVIIIKYIL